MKEVWDFTSYFFKSFKLERSERPNESRFSSDVLVLDYFSVCMNPLYYEKVVRKVNDIKLKK